MPRTRKRRTAESAATKNTAPEVELSALISGSATCDTSSSEEVFFEASLEDFEDIDAVLQRHISGTISDKIREGGFSISGSRDFHIRIKWFPYADHVVSISGSRGFPYPDHAISVSGSCEFRLSIWIRTPNLKLNRKVWPQPTDN